jgi:hypothetical protein
MEIKEGSKWSGIGENTFVVIHVIDKDDHTWVHYRNDGSKEPREYSCYIESFLERFRELPE